MTDPTYTPGDLCTEHPDHYMPCSKCAGADCCSAVWQWPTLFGLGLALLLGACVVSRYARPDWTGPVVALLVVLGAIAVFCAGLRAAIDRSADD